MKNPIKSISAIITAIALIFFIQDIAFASKIKPPGGRTGSPADGGGTCATSGCHSGNVAALDTGIDTNIPAEGYVAKETYTITVGQGMEQVGFSTYGFQFTAQDSSGNQLGSFTPAAGTIGYIPGVYIAHSSPQVASAPSWTFEWTAPSTGSGEVNFYAAVLAANGNGSNSGDNAFTTSGVVNEKGSVSTSKLESKELRVSGNIKNEVLNLNYHNKNTAPYDLRIVNLSGQVVYNGEITLQSGQNETTVTLNSHLKSGVYVIQLQNGSNIVKSKVLCQNN
jgi:hypothetical protein